MAPNVVVMSLNIALNNKLHGQVVGGEIQIRFLPICVMYSCGEKLKSGMSGSRESEPAEAVFHTDSSI